MAKKKVAKKTAAEGPPPEVVAAYQEALDGYQDLKLNLAKLKKNLDALCHSILYKDGPKRPKE